MSIGIHDLSKLKEPFNYGVCSPHEPAFIPLQVDYEMKRLGLEGENTALEVVETLGRPDKELVLVEGFDDVDEMC